MISGFSSPRHCERPKRVVLWAAALLVPFLLYSPTLDHPFVLDDEMMVVRNARLQSPSKALWFVTHSVFIDLPGGRSLFYRPLTFLTLSWERQIWGLDPSGYHLDQILCHMATTCLAWSFLSQLLGDRRWGLLLALVWSCHPCNVEAVAYVSGRNDVLFSLFYLASLVACQRALSQPHGNRWRALSILFGVLSLGAKEMGGTVFGALFFMEVLGSRRTSPRDWISRGLLYGIPLAAYASLRLGFLPLFQDANPGGVEATRTLGDIGRTMAFYLRFAFWPGPYSIDRSSDLLPPLNEAWAIALTCGLILSILGILAAVFLARLQSLWILCGLAALSYLPISNAIPVYSVAADRYAYLPNLFLVGAMGTAVSMLAFRLLMGLRGRTLVGLLASLALLAYCLASRDRMRLFSSNETLWTSSLTTSPGSYWLHNNWGRLLQDRGETRAAEKEYREAIRLLPGYHFSEYNLACLLQQRGEIDEALAHIEKALASHPQDPQYRLRQVGLLMTLGRLEDAEKGVRELLNRRPRMVEAWHALGWIALKRGHVDDARSSFQRCLQLKGNHALAKEGLRRIQAMESTGKIEGDLTPQRQENPR